MRAASPWAPRRVPAPANWVQDAVRACSQALPSPAPSHPGSRGMPDSCLIFLGAVWWLRYLH